MAGELAAALAAAQGEFPEIVKDKVNPHFKSKYASLDGVIQATRSVLAKHGLSVTGRFTEAGLESVLLHSSGEERSCGPVPLLVDKNNMQGLGSAITYARRYGVEVLLGVAGDDDDDGNAAAGAPPQKSRQRKPEPEKPAEMPATEPPKKPQDPGVSIRSTKTPACLAELLKKWQAKKPVGADPQGWQKVMEMAEDHYSKQLHANKWTLETADEALQAIKSIFNQLETAKQGQEAL